jgi:hypothetical protein
VQHVDQQEFLAERFRKGRALAEVLRAAVELELAVALAVVDHRHVVELGRTHPEATVGVGRDQQEPVVAKEAADLGLRSETTENDLRPGSVVDIG